MSSMWDICQQQLSKSISRNRKSLVILVHRSKHWRIASKGNCPNAQALLHLREGILSRIAARATEDRFTPQRLVHDIREAMPHDGILALDNGMYKDLVCKKPARTGMANTLLLDNALATMGAGLPSAMTASDALSRTPRHGCLRGRRIHDEQPGA